MLPVLAELGIGLVSYSPLGRGFLTGAMSADTEFAAGDFRNSIPRLADADARTANLAFVELLTAVAQRKGATPAQIALAWVRAQRPWVVPIPGTTKLPRLEENIGAVNVNLTRADVAEIERAAAVIQVEGERYPEHLMKTVGR